MKLSILDYVPIFENRNATDALNHTVKLAQLAEKYHFKRYWVAEHHQVYSVASSAPEMIMMSLLENTTSINIGSGGIMLPHYSAYKVAEQFKILEARHTDRVDLGIGRSPSFNNVNKALNEGKNEQINYETQLADLSTYFNDDKSSHNRFQQLLATPLIDSQPNMFLLSTSEASAKIAASKGLPLVIALMGQSQNKIDTMIETYRHTFLANHTDKQPYIIVATFVISADDEPKISALTKAFHLWLLRINYLEQPQFYPSPQFVEERGFSTREQEKIAKNEQRVVSGTISEVHRQLMHIQRYYDTDEIMVLPHVYGEKHRERLITLLGEMQ
ncbi:LLM class flavin-dependent oxidoreductase [Staphylococcus sp. 18_1_E_LY]|uniref:LLM class flavin-dependent oxidoreductase n=1 Tax=Staphylococcus lloydii TaxID=2781774 RepID=A0A7T1B197_9STAP|nr:LLM class flavin-dependent oxidoreductase [Staphylococcus lloydii]MBF7020504.1 LLM class flavin-dependent oxidoreductase [Staphylococcus lloydii]MBF7028187.1 LLM class flavin-dependent oxidoreductase [Staphylococcus lloydii]QPM75849.1 LLM class flavin-dependent oxidoreductase [Staphylococcus lloydii]